MIRRIFVEKKTAFDDKAYTLKEELEKTFLVEIEDLRIFYRYDIENLSEYAFNKSKDIIFYEPSLEDCFVKFPGRGYRSFVVENINSNSDSKALNIKNCLNLMFIDEQPLVKTAVVYSISGVNDSEFDKIKNYIINPLSEKEGAIDEPDTLIEKVEKHVDVTYPGFIKYKSEELKDFYDKNEMVISFKDLLLIQDYFKSINRNPTETELKLIETLWSDHCKHTTINTNLRNLKINSDNPHIEKASKLYDKLFKEIYGEDSKKKRTLLDIGTIGLKKQLKSGKAKNIVDTLEKNACAIDVDVDVDGKNEKWVVMFDNKTCNTPTEIEPFGGASTGLAAAMLDPLSGRSYAYQAMRISGAADPRQKVTKIEDKIAPYYLSTKSINGHATYGSQVGIPTGLAHEIYHEGYRAKRLEADFVIGAVKKENIISEDVKEGDLIFIIGAKTTRVGTGAASAASKKTRDKKSSYFEGGDPIIGRSLLRLFKNPEVTKIIKKCNDVSTGGLAVSLLEMAKNFDVNLNLVPAGEEGLTGTEIAISETQNRLIVTVEDKNAELFKKLANDENLNAVKIATITNSGLVRMFYNGDTVVNLTREFIDLYGENTVQDVVINENKSKYMNTPSSFSSELCKEGKYKEALFAELGRLNVCSQKGLAEVCDSTINSSSVFMPYGGKFGQTPSLVMASKIPVEGITDTATVASFGCYPLLSSNSPFVGSIYSIVTSLSKQVAAGVKLGNIKLSLQEYFKQLGNDENRWGEPVSALLGALYTQMNLGVSVIGERDSMNGSFEKLDVPPTIISFACGVSKASKLISNCFIDKVPQKNIYQLHLKKDEFSVPDFDYIQKAYLAMSGAIDRGEVVACSVVEEGGAISAAFKACMGNRIGTTWENIGNDVFEPQFGDFVFQAGEDISAFNGLDVKLIAKINGTRTSSINGDEFKFGDAFDAFVEPLSSVFPISMKMEDEHISSLIYCIKNQGSLNLGIAKPKVLIPIFPGTTSEYDMKKAFERAGGECKLLLIKNRTKQDIQDSINEFAKEIATSQILALPGGFSDCNKMDTSKYIVSMFEKNEINDAFMDLIYKRNGLALGIGNGFQAFVKLGFIPFGELKPQNQKSSNFIQNAIGRHVSSIVRTRVATNKTPWLMDSNLNSITNIPISCSNGRFVTTDEELEYILKEGLVATQYVDNLGDATMISPYNPTGSVYAIEGLISPNGHIFGKMGHNERYDENLYKNIHGEFDMDIFKSGVRYFE